MKINMKKNHFIIYLVGLIIISIFLMTGCTNPASIYEKNWGISLPKKMIVEYEAKTDTSFHGDGKRYTIFKVNSIPENFLSSFNNEKNEDFVFIVKSILVSLDVPESNMSDCEEDYCWQSMVKNEHDHLYMLYITNSQRLYICQVTM